MTTVAVMQPYFLPYAGYFRLFAAADRVAFFDCVQFPRRGWVHRNRLPDALGRPAWLTLPLQRAPMSARIMDLRFAADARERLAVACRRFPDLADIRHPLCAGMLDLDDSVCGYLEKRMRRCCNLMGLPFRTVRTSSLDLDPSLEGQDRVIAAVEALGADSYVNLEGGRDLYQPSAFESRGMRLRILPE